jgi:hypothetical protein
MRKEVVGVRVAIISLKCGKNKYSKKINAFTYIGIKYIDL